MSEDQRFLDQIRTAVADYMWSEGCGCCDGREHPRQGDRLCEILGIPKDENGRYAISDYRTKETDDES